MKNIVNRIRQELKQESDKKTRESGQRFFKEKIKFYGVKTATTVKIGKKYFKEIGDLGKQEIFALCEDLFMSGYMEEFFIASSWSYNTRKNFSEKDFRLFKEWIDKYVDNWAKCDTFCNHTVGVFLEAYPDYVKKLQEWARSENRWLRRASAVSLIIPARNGNFLGDIFKIADILLIDGDDMVQKGYGWMLKEASRKRQKEVFDYVVSNKSWMPRTALRYAIEKMPESLRKKAMQKDSGA